MLSVAALVVASSMVVGQTEVKVPQKVLAHMEFLVGDWEQVVEFGGQTRKESRSTTWSPGKHCIIITARGDRGIASAIGGWDPATNELVETWYVPDGMRAELRCSNFSEAGWDGTAVLHDAAGTTNKVMVRVSRNGANEFTFTAGEGDSKFVARNKRVKKQ